MPTQPSTAQYNAILDGTAARQILKNTSIPSGIVATRGSVRYHHSSRLPFLDSLTIDGSLTSGQLEVREKQIRTQVRDVAAHYSLKNGDLSIQQAHANLLGGAANGDIVIRNFSGNSRGR